MTFWYQTGQNSRLRYWWSERGAEHANGCETAAYAKTRFLPLEKPGRLFLSAFVCVTVPELRHSHPRPIFETVGWLGEKPGFWFTVFRVPKFA